MERNCPAEVVVQVNASSSCIERALPARLPSGVSFCCFACTSPIIIICYLIAFLPCVCDAMCDYQRLSFYGSALPGASHSYNLYFSLSHCLYPRGELIFFSVRASHYTASLINALHNFRFVSLATHSLLIAPFVLPSGQAPLFDFLQANTGSLNNL